MKDIVVSAMLIAIGIAGLTNTAAIRNLYAGAFPQSRYQRDALDNCAAASSGFDRLEPTQREACYVRVKVAPNGLPLYGAAGR